MKSQSRSRSFFISLCALLCVLFATQSGCQSKGKKAAPSNESPNALTPAASMSSEGFDPTGGVGAPGSRKVSPRELSGKAFAVDGKSVAVLAVAPDDSRRPVAIEDGRVAFSARRPGTSRWQVYELDRATDRERRVSFDAGDAEPVAAVDGQLIVASSSDDAKDATKILSNYRGRFPVDKPAEGATVAPTGTPAPTSVQINNQVSLQEKRLLKGRNQNSRAGSFWEVLTPQRAARWVWSSDEKTKAGIALAFSTAVDRDPVVQRLSLAQGKSGFAMRAWTPVKVDRPKATANTDGAPTPSATPVPRLYDGHIFPDGSRVVWSDGAQMWTTLPNGHDATAIGTGLPPASDLTVSANGEWIVFSSPTSDRGLNLMAVHRNGRCLRTLTELPGDEMEPAFDNKQNLLYFTVKEGDNWTVAVLPFGQAPCP